MMGSRWKEVRNVLKELAPICTAYDSGGVDLYFLSAMRWDRRKHWDCRPKDYRGIKDGNRILEIFNTEIQPQSGTPYRRSHQ